MRPFVLIAAVFVLSSVPAAFAEQIRYDNPAGPGHFEWDAGAPGEYTWLDITLPPAAQPASEAASALAQIDFGDGTSGVHGGAFAAVTNTNPNYVVGLNEGDLVGASGQSFNRNAYIYCSDVSELPEGVPTYLGIMTGTMQFGWIAVVRTGLDLDAFAWGYETEGGIEIPAGIPEPATVVLLGIGAVAAARFRRLR